MDLCFELASLVMDRLSGSVTVVEEVHGFKYFEVRDLLGFVDGTENPDGSQATAAVTIGAEDPEFTGSSYVVVQKYVHDLAMERPPRRGSRSWSSSDKALQCRASR